MSFFLVNIAASVDNRPVSSPMQLFKIQNVYIELLFKYMLYQFSYKEAILRFFGLVKTCLDLCTLLISCDELKRYDNMLETIVKQTEQTLILHSKDNK